MLIGLIGNQNSGKTTLFNHLTGDTAKIGNWPGVTVQKRSGFIKGTKHEIVDLPGIYSLSPYTIEEQLSKDFILNEKPDIIINVVDSTSIERSLYLTTQLLELNCKVIIALNIIGSLSKFNINLNTNILSKYLNVKVIEISALTGLGINNLVHAINYLTPNIPNPIFNQEIENTILTIETSLPQKLMHKRFIAIKLLEEDESFSNYSFKKLNSIIIQTKKLYDTETDELIATKRYRFIENALKTCSNLAKHKGRDGTLPLHKKDSSFIKKPKETATDKLDKIVLNKFLGFPIFFIIIFLVYFLSVDVVGKYATNKISNYIAFFSNSILNILKSVGIPKHLTSLMIDGIVPGVSSVLSFLPQLFILFLLISLLETGGYMSRISMLFDSFFRKLGLSGKSLIPFIVGSSCSVPGIMASRIIENNDERKKAVILTPFIPCSAKLPIIALFSSYFFTEYSGLVAASLYLFSIAIIIFSSLLFKKFIFKNTTNTYMLELPKYKIPNAKYVLKDVFQKLLDFIKRAGSIILLCSVALWFLLSFSPSFSYTNNIEQSLLAYVGNKLSWFLSPFLGVQSWHATISSIQGLIAKEQVISSMSIISGFTGNSNLESNIFSQSSPFSFFTTSSAYAFMVFNLFSAPCIAAISAMHKELGSFKTTVFAICFQIFIAWLLATIIFNIGKLLENKMFNINNFFVILIIFLIIAKIIVLIIKNKHKIKSNNCAKCNNYNPLSFICEKH